MNSHEEKQAKINHIEQLAAILSKDGLPASSARRIEALLAREISDLTRDTNFVKPFEKGDKVAVRGVKGACYVEGYVGLGFTERHMILTTDDESTTTKFSSVFEADFKGVTAWVEPAQAEEVVEQPKERDYPLPVKIPVKLDGLTYVLADYVDYNGTPDWMLLTGFKRGKYCATHVPPNLHHLVTQAY